MTDRTTTTQLLSLCPVVWVAVLGLLLPARGVGGRGRLMDPPARSSMWRLGYNTPINYDDNGLNCGGRVIQWTVNDGKCGVCGDAFNGPRDNERGGKYSTGLVTRSYTQGQAIEVRVDVTANEKGWFEFNLCPQSDPLKPVTEDCLRNNTLRLASGGIRYPLPATANGYVRISVVIPDNVVCDRCVFRWKWNTGNTWGTGPDGKGCLGCGVQEQFFGCADVAVRRGTGAARPETFPPPTVAPPTPYRYSPPSKTAYTTSTPTTSTTTTTTTTTAATTMKKATTPTTTVTPSTSLPTTATSVQTTDRPSSVTNSQSTSSLFSTPRIQTVICKGINEWAGKDELDQWCQVNCVTLNICPPTLCTCDS